MQSMSRYQPVLVAMVLVVLSGIVHGFWTDRWAVSQAPAEAAARLEQVPMTAGDWQAQGLPVNSRMTEAISGQMYRRYVNRTTGNVVTVALISGLPGPVSIHTPDVCYKAGGYDVGTAAHYHHPAQGAAPAADFLTSDMHKNQATGPLHQRIFWSWTSTGDWKVPDNPRYEFAGKPVLFKLYVIREMNAPNEPLEDDPCIDLMRRLLPQLQQSVFSRS
jgi:hypothetical protein